MDIDILKGLVFPMELKEATLSVSVSDELYKKVHNRKPDDWYDQFTDKVNQLQTHASTEDFIAFAKDWGLTVKPIKSDNPDTFDKVFGEDYENLGRNI